MNHNNKNQLQFADTLRAIEANPAITIQKHCNPAFAATRLSNKLFAFWRATADLIHTIKPLKGLVRSNIGFITILAVFSVLGALLVLGDVLVVGAIIDNLVNGADPSAHLLLFALLTLFIVARHGLVFIENAVSFVLQTRLSLRLRGKLFGSLLTREQQRAPTRDIGELVHIETASLTSVQSHVTDELTDLVNAVLMLAVAISLMIQFSGKLASGFVLLATVWFVLSLLFYPLAEKYSRQVHEVTSRSRLHFLDGLINSKLVNRLGIGTQQVQQYIKQLLNESIVAGRVLRFNLWQDLYSGLLPVLLVLMSYALGGMMVIQQEITVGQMVAFNLICSRAILPLNRLLDTVMGLSALKVSCEKVFSELDLDHPISINKTARRRTGLTPATLHARSLSKRLAGTEIFHDIDLHLTAGELMVIEGASGSGKSTLLEILAGTMQADSGTIRYGTTDIGKMSRRDIQLVSADPEFLVGTVADNLFIALEEQPQQHLVDVCIDCADCEHLICHDKSGLDIVLDDEHPPFSRGELQRLSLCRSLLLQPHVLLLDESLSGLGQKQSLKIIKKIRRNWPNMTILVASHRDELNAIADQRLQLK